MQTLDVFDQNQTITSKQQVTFAKRFGEIHPPVLCAKETPDAGGGAPLAWILARLSAMSFEPAQQDTVKDVGSLDVGEMPRVDDLACSVP